MNFNRGSISKISIFKNGRAFAFKLCIALFVLLFTTNHTWAQANGDYRTNAAGTWNWNTTANWQYYNAGAWGVATNYPGQVAGTGTVTIRNGANVTLNVSPTNAIGNLTFAGGTTTATSVSINGYSLAVTGAITLNDPGNGTGDQTLSVGSGTLSCASVTMANTGGDTEDLLIDITTGTLNVSGNFATSGAANENAFNITSTGTLNIGGNFTGTGTVNCTPSGTVTYYGTNQTMKSGNFYNLNVTGTANLGGITLTVSGTTTVTGTITCTSTTGTKTMGNVVINGGAWTSNVNETYATTALTLNNAAINGTGTGRFNVSSTMSVPSGTTTTVNNGSLYVTGNTTIDGSIIYASTNGTKDFTGNVTVSSSGSWTCSANEGFTFRGNLQNDGTFSTGGTATHTFAGANKTLSGTSGITIPTMNITGSYTNQTTVTIANQLNGTGGTLTQFDNSTLNIADAGTIALSNLVASATGNTVNYYYAGNQTVRTGGTTTAYYNLILSGTGNKTLTGLTTVNGNLTTSTTGTLAATTAAGLTIGGNLNIGANTTFTVGGFNFTVNGSTSVSGTHPHTSVTGTKNYIGNVTINNGGTWSNAGNSAFTFQGSLANNGTLTAGTGVYTFAGLSQSLSGSNNLTIPRTTINGSYTNQTTLTVGTALSGTGSLTQADNMTLNIGGTSGISTLNATASGNTVNYNGPGQTVINTNYHHLTLSGSGIVTMPASPITVGGNFTTSGTNTANIGASINFDGDVTLGSGTTFNAGAYDHTVGGSWNNNGATFNASSGSITFDGSSSQTIGGSSPTTFNNVTVNNASGVALGNAVNASGVTLSSGLVTTTSANLLTVTGTSPSAITGSASSYINGPLARTIPANLVNGNYLFPIGKSGYNTIELVNANTNAGGNVVIQAEVFDANCGGTPGTGMSTLNTNRFWNATITSGGGNFTNTRVSLTESGLDAEDAMGQSATQSGTYNRISNDPPSGGTILSDAITSLDYFAIGKKPIVTITATQDGTEGGANGQFTLSTTRQFTVDRTINITVSGTATNGTDYTTINTSVTFPAYQNSTTIAVTVTNDFSVEPTETVIITLETGTGYGIGTPSDATVNINDNDAAGITVNPTSGLTTTEAGGQATFTVVLTSQPTANVSIGLSSSNTNEGTVSPSSLTFTNGNWSSAQTVTITGANELIDDGDIAYTIFTAAASSSDANYNGLDALDVSVTNTDNDAAGITVNPTSGLTTTEAGGQATFTMVLNSQPTANVTIDLSSDNTSEGTVSPSSVTFTNADWNSAQTITVTGANEFMVDGNVVYNIITAAATSTDGNYSGMNALDVSVTNSDNDVAGITVAPTSGLNTTEAGGQATFTIVLTSQPSADVTIALSSDDTSEGTVSPSSVTFTNGDWDSPQTITVTGVDGPMADGDITYHIVTDAASSGDSYYNGINPSNVTVVNLDNDVAGISINPVSGLVTTEAGGTAFFTIVLNTQPTDGVTINLSSSDTGEGTISPSSITFTNADWNTPQTITLAGVNDDVDDGNIAYTVFTAAATSTDADYNGMNPSDVTATNNDNDVAGITVSPTSGLTTTEAGGTATFTLRLNSEPTADVTIGISSGDTSEGTVSPTSVTFTSGNWSSTQTITITGVNDAVDDGNIAFTIVTAAASSTDGLYNGMNAVDVSATNTDDDAAGVTVNPTSGLTTTEAGGQASFTIVLSSEPTADVVIDVVSGDPTEGTVSVASLTFTSGNWSSAQTITITGQNDFVMDGDIAYSILTTVEPGADALYNAINPSDVSVTNTDNDVAGITVNPISGLVTTEAGGTATFNVRLNSEPTANVVIGISSGDASEGTVSPSSLTFTSANWSSNQTVTITGVNDFVDDGDIAYTIITAVATSTDGNYNGMNASDVSVTNTDNDVAGITVNPTSGLTTTEAGATANFTVVLTSEPTATVSIGISSSNTNEGTVSTTALMFTSGNWNIAQTVTITGVNDYYVDGNIGYTIITDAASSTDGLYSGMNASNVSVTNNDNDVAQIIVNPTSGLTTSEGGSSATFTIVLTSIPTGDVTISLTSSDLTEGTVSLTSVVLNSSNWDSPQDVTVTGANDDVDDGNIAFNIITGAASSSDANYNGINPSDVSTTNLDDDVAGIFVDPTSGLVTSENLTSATFTIVLESEPTANVTINLSVDDNTEGQVSPSSVSFTPGNWITPQTVTITGKNDNQSDGDIIFNVVTAAASSSDPNYSGLNADNVEVTNLDNDNPGITVSPTSGLTTNEAGGTATFTVVLITQPSDDVTIDLFSGDTSEGTVSPSTLTFTGSNWETPQTVTITGENDDVIDGNVAYTITLNPATSDDNDYDGINPDDVSVTNTDLTPTITPGSNPTICAGAILANLMYSATTKSPDQYSIDFDGTAETAGFIDVTNMALPSSPITITVPAGASPSTYNGTLTVRNSSYGTCISPENSIQIIINGVNGGTVADDQTLCSGGNPAAFTSSTDGSGSGVISYRWESSTANCSSGFSNIGGETSSTYDPPLGITQSTYFRRVTISTLNGVACEANSNCLTVTINTISATISIIDGDDECPELDIAKGFNPDNNGPYSAGATEVVFRVSRQNSTAPTWEFDYEVQDATVYATSPEDQTGTISGIGANYYDLHFYITNDPGNLINVKLVVSEVSDSDGCSDPTDREEIINVFEMPAVGPFE